MSNNSANTEELGEEIQLDLQCKYIFYSYFSAFTLSFGQYPEGNDKSLTCPLVQSYLW